jgi:hypothetical protein
VSLLEKCPVPATAIHAAMLEDGDPISLSAVHSWRTGRDFPSPENLPRLVAALRRIGGGVEATAVAVAQLTPPEHPSKGKRGPGKRGRPRKALAGDVLRPAPARPPHEKGSFSGDAAAGVAAREPYSKERQVGGKATKKRGKRKEEG